MAVIMLPGTTVYILQDNQYNGQGGDSTYYAAGDYAYGPGGAYLESAQFGADPAVSITYSGNNGGNTVTESYSIELFPVDGTQPADPPNAYGPSQAVGIQMNDVVQAPSPPAGYADAIIKITDGPKDALNLESCANGANGANTNCDYGGNPDTTFTTANFDTVHTVDLVPYAVYTVTLSVDVSYSGVADLDPTFTAPAGYTLLYSPGVVPEPAAWAMMLLGVGGVGGTLRSARRKAGAETA